MSSTDNMWEELSMSDRAKYIMLAVHNGVTDLNTIRHTYNSIAEGGPYSAGKMTNALYESAEKVENSGEGYLGDMNAIFPSRARKFGDGGWKKEDPIVSPKIPESDDQESITWIANWLNNRRKQLYSNLDNVTGDAIYRTNISKPKDRVKGDIRDDGWDSMPVNITSNPLQLLKGNNPRRILLNRVYYGQINSAASAPEITLTSNKASSYNTRGAYITPNSGNNTGHYIVYQGIPDKDVRIHERTHALNAEPQEKTIGTIVDENKYNDKYLDDEREIYSRLMEFRYKYKLSPNKTITKQYLDNHREELKDKRLDRYDDDLLLKLFNDVAYNPTYINNDVSQNLIT